METLGKRKVGRPMKRSDDDIRTKPGKNWTQKAQKRDVWKELEATYLRQWRS